MKKIGIYLVYVLAVVFIMLAFACGTIAFAELGYSAVLVFTFGYAFALLSIYLIFILHELGHALWLLDRLSAGGFWIRELSFNQKVRKASS